MTPQGILVLEPGAVYQPYCNVCRWTSSINARTLPDAQSLARAHASKCGTK